MNLSNIINEYTEYQSSNRWKDVFQNAKFDSDTINYTCSIGRHSSNLKYNRYRDILPYDHTRVILNDAGDTDYINANFVECKLAKRKYILAQGPLLTTCEHFWQMIWEQNSRGIIMLNRIIEKGARKCDVYYPNVDEDDSDLEMTFGKFQISYLSEQPCEDYVIRKLEVENLDLKETREVYHCHYTNWPDFGEPSDKSFLKFLIVCEDLDLFNTSLQTSSNGKSRYGPSVVHCSAGVGRSGTLVLVDAVLSLFKIYGDNAPMTIMDVLSELRRGRMGLVQTHQQLKFAYESIIDGIQLLMDNQEASSVAGAGATASSISVDSDKSTVKTSASASSVGASKHSFSSDDDDDDEYKERVRRRKQRLLEASKAAQQQQHEDRAETARPLGASGSSKRPIIQEDNSDNDDNDVIDDEDDNSSDSDEFLFAKTNRDVSTVKVNQPRKPAELNVVDQNVQNKETKSGINEVDLINESKGAKAAVVIVETNNNNNNKENNVSTTTELRQRAQTTKSTTSKNERDERISSIVEKMRSKQLEHEQKISSKVTFNRYKPYIVGGGMLIASILFMKIYRNYVSNYI